MGVVKKTIDCDVLIIGGGLAASMAAIEAAKRGVKVVLVDKGRLGRSGSSSTSGGVPEAAFGHTDPRDSKEIHFNDTITAGDFIPHQKIVRAIVNEVTDRVVELEEIGGIFINERCKTGIGGLYAAGESSTGTHGSNRLSGNAIASALVLGARSGKFATDFALGSGFSGIDEREVLSEIERIESFKRDEGIDPNEIEGDIREIAWESTGVVRNENGLKRGLRRFEEIRRDEVPKIKVKNLRDRIKALECGNLAWVEEMVARCALERRESRGQHNREDYPKRDDKNWLKWVIVQRDGDRVGCKIEPISFDGTVLKPPTMSGVK
ncbi:MAG: FAD-dependent oxidoreductase [Candidatus Binatia bacterium]